MRQNVDAQARAHYAGQLDGVALAHQRDGEPLRGWRADVALRLGALDAALDDTREERVRALAGAEHPSPALVAVLGEPPAAGAGRKMWCALAWKVTAYRDRHPVSLGDDRITGVLGARPGSGERSRAAWEQLAYRLGDAERLMAVAARRGDDGVAGDDPVGWQATLEAPPR